MNNVINMANGSPIYLNTGSSNLMCMMINSNRLSSYNCGWSLDFLTPSQMANAGFYYVGLEDCVRCVFCSTEFSEWKLGDDPLAEHKRRSPYCPFFSITSSKYEYFIYYNLLQLLFLFN